MANKLSLDLAAFRRMGAPIAAIRARLQTANPRRRRSAWMDPDDCPEWADEQLARAEARLGDEGVKPAAAP